MPRVGMRFWGSGNRFTRLYAVSLLALVFLLVACSLWVPVSLAASFLPVALLYAAGLPLVIVALAGADETRAELRMRMARQLVEKGHMAAASGYRVLFDYYENATAAEYAAFKQRFVGNSAGLYLSDEDFERAFEEANEPLWFSEPVSAPASDTTIKRAIATGNFFYALTRTWYHRSTRYIAASSCVLLLVAPFVFATYVWLASNWAGIEFFTFASRPTYIEAALYSIEQMTKATFLDFFDVYDPPISQFEANKLVWYVPLSVFLFRSLVSIALIPGLIAVARIGNFRRVFQRYGGYDQAPSIREFEPDYPE